MKLVMFQNIGDPRLGCLLDDQVVDLNLAYEAMLKKEGDQQARLKASVAVPDETIRFLEGGKDTMQNVQKALAWIRSQQMKPLKLRGFDIIRPTDSVQLLAPVMKPSKIICIAHNYHDFCEELKMKPHSEPRIFAKYANTVAAHNDDIIRPAMSNALGYEVELAFVVGSRCKHVPESRAYEYIAGYMAFNDISASDLTIRDVQNLRGKSFDTFAPMGPFLLTSDELPDPHNLAVSLKVNGKVLQKSNTNQLVHNVPQLLAFCSEVFTLEAGDIVATGTPGGLAKDRTPTTYMEPGDIMETEVEGLGVMRNTIRAE